MIILYPTSTDWRCAGAADVENSIVELQKDWEIQPYNLAWDTFLSLYVCL